ncbi:UNVERIFIED_CONTAM: F-box/LRR-repeat protein 17 [Sesamum angustifolium]|uniref:F-box/LRR-repeat protein 17 n=1 Tax=Sesamum angustifolium TaxID=2727405 RepID=A0AAW2MIQ1_9LAMI
MKRVNEAVDDGSKNLGLKKVRFFNGTDESCGASQSNEGDEERAFVGNGGIGSAPADPFGNVVPDNLDGQSLGGLKDSNIWDFDINFDLIFGNEEEQKGLAFDLNIPVNATQDGGIEEGCLEYCKGAMINQNKEEIIVIASDDSDSEVEVIGYTFGYNAKGKQVDSETPYDRMENLSLELGMVTVDNAAAQSSLVTGGKRRYTREEKGKANVVDESWLSLKAIDSDMPTDYYESIRSTEPTEDIEAGTWQPAASNARSDLAERALRQADQALRIREASTQESWREAAKRFARANDPNQNNRNKSSSQKQGSPTSAVEQLGKSPGPFSEALKMVRERTSKRAVQQLIEWKPSEEKQNQNITTPFAPSLLDVSLKALAENAEGIVSLELVPDNLRRRLTDMLCDMRKMNLNVLNLLLQGCPTEIRIKNCSWLTDEQFQQTFRNCQTKDLRVLQLDLCGQCMLDFAFRDALTHSSDSLSRLAIVSLRGACRLSDSGLKDLVMSARALQSINLGHCTLLTCDAINIIAESLGSNLRELYIDDCQKINAMLILPAFKKFKHLEVLSVAGIQTISDQFVSEIITVCGQSIKELDLADCLALTDCSLKTIGSNCADLCALNIANLHNLTDLGLEYLANGCKSIQKLKLCRNGFSDEAMAAFLECSGESLMELLLNNMTMVGPNTALSLAKHSRKLLSLDISWCRRITNEALGLIVDSCSSLKLLKVFGCRQITNVSLNGHSNPFVRIIGLNLTPILDHVNLLEPEEVLLRYSPLTMSQEVWNKEIC